MSDNGNAVSSAAATGTSTAQDKAPEQDVAVRPGQELPIAGASSEPDSGPAAAEPRLSASGIPLPRAKPAAN